MYNNVQHSLKCTTNVQHFRPVVHQISTAGLPPYRPTGSSPEHIASIQSQGQQRASEIVDFTWKVSDCEELVGGYSQEMMGLVLTITSIYFPNKT